MKKALCVILALLVCVSVFFCGCGKSDKVTVTINASTLSQAELSDLEKFARDNGFDKAVYNKRKGVIEVTLGDTEHDKLTYSLGVTVIRNVYGLIDSEEYPYIKAVERNDIFSEMKVLVKQSAYEKAGKGEEISDYVGKCCLVYLNYEDMANEDKVCTVKIADEKTGVILSEKTYSVADMS